MIEFAHPWYLLLLALIVPLLWFALRGSIAGLSPGQQRLCFALRLLILALLVCALAGLRVLLPSSQVSTIFAVDDSASISESAANEARQWVEQSLGAQRRHDLAGVVGFGRQSKVWLPPAQKTTAPKEWPVQRDATESHFGNALTFASALLPAEGARRLVLLSDGNDTGELAIARARELANQGVEVWTVPLHNPPAPEVLVERVEVPRRLKSGEPFDLVAQIRSSTPGKAKVKLYQNQFLLKEEEIELKTGANEYRTPNLQVEGTFVTFEVEVEAAQDTQVNNNRAAATATLQGEPRVLLVDSEERQVRPLAEVLRREKISVETRGQNGLPRSLEDLQQFDLFLLSDVSALQLSREQMELYRRWVQDFGGGFMLLGGENSYGVGGYYRTPIEQMLPVRMEHEDRQDTPSVALLVVLDRSGSMSAQVQGQTKMSLANQGAVFAMKALQPRDQFGVLAVDTRVHAIAPLGPLSGQGQAEQKILTIKAGGGGIYVYTSLADALQRLRDVQARIKHVILFSDAADAEEKTAGEMSDGSRVGGSALDLASAMLAAKITTSVVALGAEQDKDTAFLRTLAERGNGRFYLTSDATTLPQIFSTETMKVAQSSLVEEPFLAMATGTSPMLSGIDWPQSPLLLGYNSTKPKPTAEVLLATERGEPLFATWRYGLGQAAGFTSDAKSRWAAEWLAWPGYGKFWTQVVRGLMRRTEHSTFRVDAAEVGQELRLTVDALTPEGGYHNGLPLQIHALSPDGARATKTATQVAPGRYESRFPLAPEGTTVFSISSPSLPDATYTFGHTRSYPREFFTTETNEPLLRAIAEAGGGRFAARPEEIFSPAAQSAPLRRDLSEYLLMLALLLFPVDIWLRRRA